jgi:hypothetical protein
MPGLPRQWTGTRDAVPPSTVVHAVILSHGPAASTHGGLLGRAEPGAGAGGSTVVIFNDTIADLAKFAGLPHATVLTLALTHELGHVLLPAPAHQQAGIMMPAWDSWSIIEVAKSVPVFTSEQSRLIRRYLIDRATTLSAGSFDGVQGTERAAR